MIRYVAGFQELEERKERDFSVEIDNKMIADDLKQEISNLRQTLQDEIAELRKELKGNYL